jgi:hypothetical protein
MKNQLTINEFLPLILFLILIGCNTTEKKWEEAQSVNNFDSYNSFIQEFPESNYADSARRKIIELNYYEALRINTVESLENFLMQYPQDTLASKARNIHEKLLWDKALEEKTLGLYEKYLSTYPEGIFGKKFKVELSSDWFSKLPVCKDDLSVIQENAVRKGQNTIYKLKSLSVSGPQSTKKIANGNYIFMPDPKRGATVVSGVAQTSIANVYKNANLKIWDYIYSDTSKNTLQGWAVGMTSGELIFPIWVLEDGPDDKYIENYFEIKGFCNNCFTIILNPEKKHKIFLEQPQFGLPFFTINFTGTVINIGNRTFTRENDGWYFSLKKE